MLKEVIYLLRVGNRTLYPGTRSVAVPAPRVPLLPGSPLLLMDLLPQPKGHLEP